MFETGAVKLDRRELLAGVAAGSLLLLLPGCMSVGAGLAGGSLIDMVKRLLTLSTQDAFAKLTRKDGFWDSTVARIRLPRMFDQNPGLLKGVLASRTFRDQLQHHLNTIAEKGAERVAPLAADAIRNLSVTDAAAVLGGGPTAATSELRAAVGPGLINALIPPLGSALQAADDPVVAQAMAVLTGVNLTDAAHALAIETENAIWYEIGASEASIRANPEATGDAALIAALRGPGGK